MGPPFGSALEYLDSVLTQRGPTATPYDEHVKWNIREHVSELQKVFPTLSVKLSEYHSNEGRLLHILKAEGTIPIQYQGAKYNIPILIWLPERYPYTAPLVFVVPTTNMIVRAGRFVNPSGQVATPLINGWLFPGSNLVDAVLEMSQVFSTEPPLYTRPAGYTPPQQQQQQPQPGPPSNVVQPPRGYASSSSYSQYPSISLGGGGTPYATPSPGNTPNTTPGPSYSDPSTSGWGGGPPPQGMFGLPGGPPPPPPPPMPGMYGMYGGQPPGGMQPPRPPPPAPPVPPPQPQPPPAPKVRKEDLEAVFRQPALDALAQQLRAAERSFAGHVEEETHKALEVQHKLMDRRAQLSAARDVLTKERMSTEQVVAELGSKTKALQGWLERNEPRAAMYNPDTMPVNTLLVPVDDLCRQGLETQAKDLAYEDTILALDRLLQTGQVPLEAYLKQVRGLCRKQFVARAMGLKVAAAQSAAPERPSAGLQSRPYPLPHGDAWSHGVHVVTAAEQYDVLRNPLANGGT